MARRYAEEKTYEFSDEATTVRAETIARAVLSDALEPLYEGVRVHVAMTADGGYEASGDDWDAVLADLTADGLLPTRTYVAFYPLRDLLLTNPPVIWGDRARRSVSVEIVSDNEGAVRAAMAKIDRLVSPLIAKNPDLNADSPAVGTPQPSASVTPTAPALAPVADTARAPSWLARTWREHTAVFVVTVLGTIVSAIVIAALNIGG